MNEEKWREKSICHSCKEKDNCGEGKKRNYNYGSIVVRCTAHIKIIIEGCDL